jgi:DNA-binding beta-propeller fold protein YncE
VEIGETASSPSQPSSFRTSSIPLSKFPTRFELSSLSAIPTQIAPGGSTLLMWRGSPATYTLSYNPSGATPVVVNVANTGPYTASNLTKAPSVTFTLQASLTVPGQDQPLVLQRQATVDVYVAAPVITAFTGMLSGGGATPVHLTLAWSVQGSGLHCSLSGSPYEVAPTGSTTVPSATIPQLNAYTLTASNGSGSVSATLRLRWTSRVTTIPLPEAPLNIAASKDGRRAYVCSRKSLSVIDMATLTPVGSPKPFPSTLAFVNVSPDGTLLYLTSALQKTVTVLDAQTLAAVGSPIAITVQPEANGVLAQRAALSPDGSRMFIPGGLGKFEVAVVDTIARAQIAAPKISYPMWAAVSVDGAEIFVSSLLGAVRIIDGTTLRVDEEQIPVGKATLPVVAGPDGTRVYVLSGQDRAVTAIDTVTRAPAGPPVTIPAREGLMPHTLAVTPNGSQLICGGNGTVSLLQANPLRHIATIAMGARTNDVQISADGKVVLIASTPDDVHGSVIAYSPAYVEGDVAGDLLLFP